jgi:hypothetical protein
MGSVPNTWRHRAGGRRRFLIFTFPLLQSQLIYLFSGLSLDLLPITIDACQTGIIPDQTRTSTITLFFPEDMPRDLRGKWAEATQRCQRYTIRSLTFPSHSGNYLTHGLGVDIEADTKRSVLSILASGLPLPKSPSIQIEEQAVTEIPADDTQAEREERGWWTLRFQQVLREMQRGESNY